MADDFRIEVDSAELRKALRYIGDAGLKKELATANRVASDVVVRQALSDVPVRTGALRASVKALGSQRDGRVKAGSARVPYAAAIHWGRGSGNRARGQRGGPIKGRHFLWDAARRVQEQVTDTYLKAIDRLLDHMRSR